MRKPGTIVFPPSWLWRLDALRSRAFMKGSDFTFTWMTLPILCLFVVGCIPQTLRMAPTVVPSCLGINSTVEGGKFKLSITDVDRSDQLKAPEYGMVLAQQRQVLGGDTPIRPQNSFLVLTLKIRNISRGPLAWTGLATTAGSYMHKFRVVSDDGLIYEESPNVGTMFMQNRQVSNINPNAYIEGTVVFDVPENAYTFDVLKERYGNYGLVGLFITNSPIFRCRLGNV